MKTVVKRAIKDEKGQAMLLAVILLLVCGLIVSSLLSFMGTGLLIGPVYEGRVAELYAADAGVEDAAWKIQQGEVPVCPGDPIWSYNISDVNDKVVQITIEYLGEGTYKITSIAVTADGGNTAAIDSATIVEAYVSPLSMNFSALLDHAIVSYNTIGVKPGDVVNGDIWLPNEDDLSIQPASTEPEAVINGTIKDNDDMTITWPTAEQLSGYYLDQVDPSNPYPYTSIDIKYTKDIGPCYIEGDFVVDNTGDPDTLILDGTVYVRDDAKFSQAGSHDYTINLNGNTIFAEGSIKFPSNAVTISGSGCIIAVGDINFQPSIVSGEDDFVLVMSITGTVWFKPSGDFTGCVAGNTEVQLQPQGTINWISPEGKGINFPMGGGGNNQSSTSGLRIDSWEVSQL